MPRTKERGVEPSNLKSLWILATMGERPVAGYIRVSASADGAEKAISRPTSSASRSRLRQRTWHLHTQGCVGRRPDYSGGNFDRPGWEASSGESSPAS